MVHYQVGAGGLQDQAGRLGQLGLGDLDGLSPGGLGQVPVQLGVHRSHLSGLPWVNTSTSSSSPSGREPPSQHKIHLKCVKRERDRLHQKVKIDKKTSSWKRAGFFSCHIQYDIFTVRYTGGSVCDHSILYSWQYIHQYTVSGPQVCSPLIWCALSVQSPCLSGAYLWPWHQWRGRYPRMEEHPLAPAA